MAKTDFDLYEHQQAVMKKLMTKDFREYLKTQGELNISESGGQFKVNIDVKYDMKDSSPV